MSLPAAVEQLVHHVRRDGLVVLLLQGAATTCSEGQGERKSDLSFLINCDHLWEKQPYSKGEYDCFLLRGSQFLVSSRFVLCIIQTCINCFLLVYCDCKSLLTFDYT